MATQATNGASSANPSTGNNAVGMSNNGVSNGAQDIPGAVYPVAPRKRKATTQDMWQDAGRKVISRNKIQKIVSTFLKSEGSAQKLANQLCPTCQSLDLIESKFLIPDPDGPSSSFNNSGENSEEPRFGVGSGSGNFELGTLRDIAAKNFTCPFCRLVVLSLSEQSVSSEIIIRPFPKPVTGPEHIMDAKCYVSWQMDGREDIRDSYGNVTETRARTRRICLHWSHEQVEDSYIVLVAQNPAFPSSLFLGRDVEPARTNINLLRSWIDTCRITHGSECQMELGPEYEDMINGSFFGVIDVQGMCLTYLPLGAKYVALSYTWGSDKRYTTTLANIHDHQSPRGIEKVLEHLPRAIRDAIKLVQALGERYLWVDSLCIIQDSDDAWDLNSRAMHLVYGNAYLTICAADGWDASDGLRGLHPHERRFSQFIEEYSPNLRLMVSHLAENYIKQSRWNTRAWTFQERLLSKRCLIFTEGRVYFQCRSTAMSEDIVAEQANRAGWSVELVHAPLQMLRDLETRPLRVYTNSLRLYTSRTLGRDSDIQAACDGIGNLIGKALGGPLIFGLPVTHFDWALLWEAQDAPNRHVIQPNGKGVKQFPSWSWCGWIGQTIEYKQSMVSGCLTNLHEWLTEHTWIHWYIRTSRGSLRPLWPLWDNRRYKNESKSLASRWKGYGAPGSDTTTDDDYGRVIKHRDMEDLPRKKFTLTLTQFPFRVHIADHKHETEKAMSEMPDLRYLQFFTWSAWLRVDASFGSSSNNGSPSSSFTGTKFRRYGITDFNGDWCGTIVLDRTWMDGRSPGAVHKFIAISEAKDFDMKEYDSWSYYIPKSRHESEWDLYYVLLVEFENAIAHRVGLGKVFKHAFNNSIEEGKKGRKGRKKWEEIILE